MTVLDPAQSTNPPAHTQRSGGRWLPWAIFLGMSWTWCIGMFLPVLLVRDYGVMGWIIFAVPNVLGAAAMGWTIRDRSASVQIVTAHASACQWFSIVTVAFHIAFVLCLLSRWILPGATPLLLVCVACLIVYLAITRGGAGDRIAAIAVLLISSISFALMLMASRRQQITLTPLQPHGSSEVWMLAPVCVFGFACCPYLDLTFHRARQHESNSAARLAFGIGFGVFFLAMIVFSLLYADPIAWTLAGGRTPLPMAFIAPIAVHMSVQSGYTMAVHAREANQLSRFAAMSLLLAFLMMFIGWALAGLTPVQSDEVVYRIFMGCYGLVFPAYVWLCMIPGHGRAAPTRRQWTVWAVAVLAATPMFWMGFVQGKMVWLLPGLGVVLLARLLVPRAKMSPGTDVLDPASHH